MIRFACTGCAAVFTAGDDKAGKLGECPACHARFVIPPADAPAANPPLPQSEPESPVEVGPCPACGARAAVLPADLGTVVECPRCAAGYTAVIGGGSEVAVARRPDRRRDWDDRRDRDDRPRHRSRSRRGRRKPGNVTAVGGMLLGGGIYALVYVLGVAVAFCPCVCWPPVWVTVVWAIFAIVRGVELIGDAPAERRPVNTLLVLQLLCVLNFDIVNLVLGGVGLYLAAQPDARAYFERFPDDE